MANRQESTNRIEQFQRQYVERERISELEIERHLDIANNVVEEMGLPLEQPEIQPWEIDYINELTTEKYQLRSEQKRIDAVKSGSTIEQTLEEFLASNSPDPELWDTYYQYLERSFIEANFGLEIDYYQSLETAHIDKSLMSSCDRAKYRIVNEAQKQYSIEQLEELESQIEGFRQVLTPLLPLIANYRKEVVLAISKTARTPRLNFWDLEPGYRQFLQKNPHIAKDRRDLITEKVEEENEEGELVERVGFVKLIRPQINELREQELHIQLCRNTDQAIIEDFVRDLRVISAEFRTQTYLALSSKRTEDQPKESTPGHIREVVAALGLNHRSILILIQSLIALKKKRPNGRVEHQIFSDLDLIDLEKIRNGILSTCCQGSVYKILEQEGFNGEDSEHHLAQEIGALEAVEFEIAQKEEDFTHLDIKRALTRNSTKVLAMEEITQIAQILNLIRAQSQDDRQKLYSRLMNGQNRSWKDRNRLYAEDNDKKQEITPKDLANMGEGLMTIVDKVLPDEIKRKYGVELTRTSINRVKHAVRKQKYPARDLEITRVKIARMKKDFDYRVELIEQLLIIRDSEDTSDEIKIIAQTLEQLLAHEDMLDYLLDIYSLRPGSPEHDSVIEKLTGEEKVREQRKENPRGRSKKAFTEIPRKHWDMFVNHVERENRQNVPSEVAKIILKDWLSNHAVGLDMGAAFGKMLQKCIEAEGCKTNKGESRSLKVTNNAAFKRVFGTSFRVQDYDQATDGKRSSGNRYYILNESFFKQWVGWYSMENKLGWSKNEVNEFAEGLAIHFEYLD